RTVVRAPSRSRLGAYERGYFARSQSRTFRPDRTSHCSTVLSRSLYFGGRASAVIGTVGLSGVSYTFFLPTTLCPEMATLVFPTGTLVAVYSPFLMAPPPVGPLPSAG